MSRRLRAGSGGRGRGGRGAAASAASPIYGISGWDASTALATASGAGVDGSAAGLNIVAAIYLDAIPSATQTIARRFGTNVGYLLSVTAAGILQAQFGTGAATVAAPTRTFVEGDVGKIHVIGMSADIAGTSAYMFFDSAQVGLSTPIAAFSPFATPMCMGSRVNGVEPATTITILGLAGGDAPLTLADYQTICAATKAAGRLSLGAVAGMTHMWRAPAAGGAMPASLSDDIGAEPMTFVVGAAANVDVVAVPDAWGF